METDFMKEVDQEIKRILNRNKENRQSGTQNDDFCNEHNLEKCLKELSQEFDYLDVSCMQENFNFKSQKSLKTVLVQLVNSSYNLIKLFKKTQKQHSNSFESNSRLNNDFQTATKTIENLRKELEAKDRQLLLNKEKVTLEKLENTGLKNKINDTKKEMLSAQKEIISERNQHKNEINKVMYETKVLQERFKKKYGTYVSDERKIVDVIDSYEKNEEKHLEMIEKLQQNNHLLLEEILALKGELAEASFKHRNK